MSSAIYPVCMPSGSFGIKQCPVHLDIADIEELIVIEPVGTTRLEIRLHVVEFTEASCKFEVGFIRKRGPSEHENTIL